ncbi:NAD(P)-binding protein, partial [Methylibium sp. T29]
MTSALRVAIVGGGWAGLAAAVEASALGHQVTLAEMAPSLGGRARRLPASVDGLALDNGQHILIGAYSATLSLLRTVGVDERTVLQRRPLTLIDAQGHGLSLPRGPALPGFVRGVLSARGWSLRERMALLCTTGGWLLRGFRCDERLTVADLTASLPATLRRALIEPLCVAALNTPAQQASAQVFLRVLRDALFAGPGASDLLLPRVDLGALWPDAAATWLRTRDA